MSWLRSSGPKPNTRYSFTVNFETHPELEPLAHHLWALPPFTKTRNQAIIKILQAGFQAMLLQADDLGTPQAPPRTAPAPVPAAPRSHPAADAVPAAVSFERSAVTATQPVASQPPTPLANVQPPAGLPQDHAADASELSPAASRFLNQFDD